MEKPRRGDRLEVVLDRLDEKGQGAGRLGAYQIHVRGGLPGDRVLARVRKVQHRRRRIEAFKDALLASDIARVEARCVHFGVCGGCIWQDVPYVDQVRVKQKLAEDCLADAGVSVSWDAPIVSESPFFYRNKMEFSFGHSPDEPVELGLHIPGRFDRVFDLEACHLQSARSNAIVDRVRGFARKNALGVYHLKQHEGFLRFLTIREGKQTGQTMVILTTSGEGDEAVVEALARDLERAFSDVCCVIHSVNRRKAQVAIGDEEFSLGKQDTISERLGNFTFEISPSSFFQTNTHQAQTLYRRVVELADLGAGDRVLDVYCGTGGISLFLSERAGRVLGIEISEAAIRDAQRNSAQNGVTNCAFMAGPAEALLGQLHDQGDAFDVAVTDPPRSGMHPKALSALIALGPRQLVYVSCNPQALGRDLAAFVGQGYRVGYAQLVDMFPHTPHCEVLAVLERI